MLSFIIILSPRTGKYRANQTTPVRSDDLQLLHVAEYLGVVLEIPVDRFVYQLFKLCEVDWYEMESIAKTAFRRKQIQMLQLTTVLNHWCYTFKEILTFYQTDRSIFLHAVSSREITSKNYNYG